jgi:hypothetical protein
MAYRYREQFRFGRFEIMYSFGNLFLLSGLFLIYSGLDTAGIAFKDVILPLFTALLWIYVISCFVMLMKLLRNLIVGIMNYKKGGLGKYR